MSAKAPPRSAIKQEHVLRALTSTYPNVKRHDWRKLTLSDLAPNPELGEAEDLAAVLQDFIYEPDAFALERDLRELVIFEIEVHNLLSDLKLRAYGKLAVDLAYYDIAFGLMTVNKHGHINEIALLPHYVDWLKEGLACQN